MKNMSTNQNNKIYTLKFPNTEQSPKIFQVRINSFHNGSFQHEDLTWKTFLQIEVSKFKPNPGERTRDKSAVYLRLKGKEHSFKEKMYTFMTEKIDGFCVHLENPSLDEGGGLKNLPPIYHTALASIPRKIKITPHIQQGAHL